MSNKIRILIILVLLFICLGVVYLVGYGTGHKSAVRDETKFGIISYMDLYKLAKAGDTNQLQDKLRFYVFCASDYYDKYFSNEVVTNQSFLRRLEEARSIAEVERARVVPLDLDALKRQINDGLRTNGQSNAAIGQIRIEKSP